MNASRRFLSDLSSVVLPQPLRDPHRREAFNRATRWLRMLARVGYVSKGAVYVVMGLLAARAAIRVSQDTASFRGALVRLVDKPFGHVMLAILALGFSGYAAWQILSAAIDAEDTGTGRSALATRLEQLFTGLVYAGLAKAAGHLLLESEPTSAQIEYAWATWAASIPQGHILLDIGGIGVMGYGLWQFWRARSRRSLFKKVNLPGSTEPWLPVISFVGRFGLAARGLVFLVFGWLILMGGLHQSTTMSANLGEALRTLGRWPAGSWVLTIVALGLISHGAYQLVNARYRRLRERRVWPWPRRHNDRGEDRRGTTSGVVTDAEPSHSS
jgi:hypothetical protein